MLWLLVEILGYVACIDYQATSIVCSVLALRHACTPVYPDIAILGIAQGYPDMHDGLTSTHYQVSLCATNHGYGFHLLCRASFDYPRSPNPTISRVIHTGFNRRCVYILGLQYSPGAYTSTSFLSLTSSSAMPWARRVECMDDGNQVLLSQQDHE